MIKYTNFLRKYVTIMPFFLEKTHFFKKKSKKKRHKTVLEDSILMVRETLYRGLPHVATLTRKQEKPRARNCIKLKIESSTKWRFKFH